MRWVSAPGARGSTRRGRTIASVNTATPTHHAECEVERDPTYKRELRHAATTENQHAHHCLKQDEHSSACHRTPDRRLPEARPTAASRCESRLLTRRHRSHREPSLAARQSSRPADPPPSCSTVQRPALARGVDTSQTPQCAHLATPKCVRCDTEPVRYILSPGCRVQHSIMPVSLPRLLQLQRV
jgi:hypothetical protein